MWVFKKYFKLGSLICDCGKHVPLSGKSDKSGVRHAHCKDCNLEWHLTMDGNIYSHPIRRR